MSSPPADPSQLWEATLGQLLLRVTRQNYDTWLRSTVGLRFEGTTLVVAAASDLACDWLSTRMRSVIAQALLAVAGPGLHVRFEPAQVNAAAADPLQPSLLPSPATPLNPRFTFTSLIQAEFNRLAATAARDVAEGNGAYSPLFITGASGCGKTHLLHAVAHAAAATGQRFLLVNAEQFLSEFTTAVRNGGGAAFRARYRDLELLLVDDVHLLIGKKATLAEFYRTLADLHDQGRRLLVAGDAAAMNGAAARFRDHLRWGLVAEITSPSAEDRAHFAAIKAAMQNVELPPEVQHYLAVRVRSSLRDLEGAVNRVTALARISREALTIDLAARALQPIVSQDTKPDIPPPLLIDITASHLGLSPADIRSEKRSRDLIYARHLAMYLLRHDHGLTYAAIAHLMGRKDHSTVVHACSQISKTLSLSPNVRADIDAIRTAVHNAATAA